MPWYKNGQLLPIITNYKLIMVRSQIGLLQEALVFEKLRDKIKAMVTPRQSGYSRDGQDAHFLLHELMAEACGSCKTLWVVFGEMKEAFPRIWRQLS